MELHGGLDRVRCLSCGERTARQALDQRLRAANADWDAIAGTMNPDGDADLADELVTGFRVVDCLGCGGVLNSTSSSSARTCRVTRSPSASP